jgi:hypothetical protein
MRKFSFLLLFIFISLSLFFAKDILADQEAYISLVEYSIDDRGFGGYNPANGTGVIARIYDNNGPAFGGKVYKISSNVPNTSRMGYTGSTSYFNYETNQIAKIDTSQRSEICTKYTVKNTGDDPIEGLRATYAEDVRWGRNAWDTHPTSWYVENGYYLDDWRLHYLNPGETKYEIFCSKIKNFPNGYMWKILGLLFEDGRELPNDESYWFRNVFYAYNTNIIVPDVVNCQSTSSKIEYGSEYTTKCTYSNSSANPVYLRIEGHSSSNISGNWGVHYRPPIYWHDFDSEILTINPGQTIYKNYKATINDPTAVNLSWLGSSFGCSLCLDQNCNQKSIIRLYVQTTTGSGVGKYLGVTDPGTISKTIIKPDNTASYLAYFNLFNPNTANNETVDGDDYYIDIQIIEEGKGWDARGSTAVTNGHYQFLVQDLDQEDEARPRFTGSFRDNDGRMYPFFYEIPNIHQLGLVPDRFYKLYITTIWRNHPRTGKDEPIDQVKRSFAPYAYLYLEDVNLADNQNTTFTGSDHDGNYIRNLSSTFPIDVRIDFSASISDFSVSPQTKTFHLPPNGIQYFRLDFSYLGGDRSNDINSTLTGRAYVDIAGTDLLTNTAYAEISIKKSAPPTANNLDTVPPNNSYCNKNYPPVTFVWTFNKPGDTQLAYNIEVDEDPNFSSPVATGRIQNSSNQCTFQSPLPQLSYGKNYYWRLKVWDSGNKSSDWIYPPNPLGQTTLKPGTLFQTTHAWPEPDFEQSPEKPAANEVVHFTDTSTCFDAECDSWLWDFGDGETSTIQSPTHAFAVTGTPNVTLTVTDSDGYSYSCSIEKGFDIGLPLPKWIETKPF